MVKASLMMAAALTALTSTGALAAGHHHRHHRVHHRHVRHVAYYGAHHGGYTIGYGDTIISGKTGFHRGDLGGMVPDTNPPDFVLSGRARGSGIGANGLPGSNVDP